MVRQSQSPAGQNVMCIVYHDIKLPAHHRRLLKLHLEKTFCYIRIFTNISNLVDYLTHQFIVNKLIIVVSGDEAKSLSEVIEHDKDSLQDPLVYELQFDNKPLKSQLSADRKFKHIDKLIEKIGDDVKGYIISDSPYDNTTVEHKEIGVQSETFPFGIHEFIGKQKPFSYLSKEELKFILFQSFIEVLLGIHFNEEEALQRMWISCREDPVHQNDHIYQQKVNEFEKTYNSKNPIQFYTKSSFLCPAVNKAFRCENIQKIYDFQPFIVHMHQQLHELRTEQQSTNHFSENVFRRGKKLPTSVLQQLKDNKDKLISMNGFLSTTKNTDVAHLFAGTGTNREGYQSVLFEMHIDRAMDTKRPYADISEVSDISEEEVLFFMGFVWCIKEVDKQSDNSWKVILEISIDIDSNLTNSFNKWNNTCSFFTLGKVLHELGEHKDALNFYELMLDSTSRLTEKKVCADIYFHMAKTAFEDGSLRQALDYLKQAEDLINDLIQSSNNESNELQPILAEDASLTLRCILMNKGLISQKRKDYRNAENFFKEALQRHGTANEKAYVHYHLGVLYFCEKNYPDARINYQKAFQLAEDALLKSDINRRLETLNQISPTSS